MLWLCHLCLLHTKIHPHRRANSSTGADDFNLLFLFYIRITASIQEVAQLFAAAGVAQLAQGFCFDLADTFTGNVELLAHLFQRAGAAIFQAKAQAQDLFFTRKRNCITSGLGM